ncbi:hypothetical protein AMIS_12420 [Actinoplanes missouriensis 431]|uniref:RCK C-terminal domain-containing protein n=1 Tax=Actinoplanes missouriensis (strain ATCC 14538 / DSM 43046 / CBS 188.64 / JCM 3121 / NBRC 102363 / NCIMB 12654 / NRRL B-3342 / UNCC 431) TaxID=512565 RepID=I0H0C5_ACTM4|nr:hypothetical protein AMIS_12420 [Actinoplanes missouriensis 431]
MRGMTSPLINMLAANTVLLCVLVLGLGHLLGGVRIRGVSLGVAAVFFVGVGVGALVTYLILVRVDARSALSLDRGTLDFRRITVSAPALVGIAVADLDLPHRLGALLTRVRRGDHDLIATPTTRLLLGDRVRVVTTRDHMPDLPCGSPPSPTFHSRPAALPPLAGALRLRPGGRRSVRRPLARTPRPVTLPPALALLARPSARMPHGGRRQSGPAVPPTVRRQRRPVRPGPRRRRSRAVRRRSPGSLQPGRRAAAEPGHARSSALPTRPSAAEPARRRDAAPRSLAASAAASRRAVTVGTAPPRWTRRA